MISQLRRSVLSRSCAVMHRYRPPRTSHCRLCDNCVEQTDHHCTFLNNCIGRRNHVPFIAFLVSSLLCSAYAIAFTVWHVVDAHQVRTAQGEPRGAAWLRHWDTIGALVSLVLTVGITIPVAGLFAYHVRLLWTNRTTIEMVSSHVPLATQHRLSEG